MLDDVAERVENQYPVCGRWSVQASNNGQVWCDASSLALGVCVQVNSVVVEDATWLRGINDGAHVNVVELEAE